MLVITNSPGANSLQFKHLGAETPTDHPAHTSVSDPTVVTQFLCPSPTMALVWAVAPVTEYSVTVLPITSPEF